MPKNSRRRSGVAPLTETFREVTNFFSSLDISLLALRSFSEVGEIRNWKLEIFNKPPPHKKEESVSPFSLLLFAYCIFLSYISSSASSFPSMTATTFSTTDEIFTFDLMMKYFTPFAVASAFFSVSARLLNIMTCTSFPHSSSRR